MNITSWKVSKKYEEQAKTVANQRFELLVELHFGEIDFLSQRFL